MLSDEASRNEYMNNVENARREILESGIFLNCPLFFFVLQLFILINLGTLSTAVGTPIPTPLHVETSSNDNHSPMQVDTNARMIPTQPADIKPYMRKFNELTERLAAQPPITRPESPPSPLKRLGKINKALSITPGQLAEKRKVLKAIGEDVTRIQLAYPPYMVDLGKNFANTSLSDLKRVRMDTVNAVKIAYSIERLRPDIALKMDALDIDDKDTPIPYDYPTIKMYKEALDTYLKRLTAEYNKRHRYAHAISEVDVDLNEMEDLLNVISRPLPIEKAKKLEVRLATSLSPEPKQKSGYFSD